MAILKLYFYFMAFLTCGNMIKDDIIVVGKAENAKAGAIVISKDDQKMYYVDGLDFWDKKIIGKMVKVKGKLLIENKNAQKEDEEISQQITGIKRIILKPKWELIK
jgi:hypothetical protein